MKTKEIKKYKDMTPKEQEHVNELAEDIYNSGKSYSNTSRELFKKGIDIPCSTLGKILSERQNVKIREQEDYHEEWRKRIKNHGWKEMKDG